MAKKLVFMTMILILSIAYGIDTYRGSVTGKQILWLVILMCEWFYLDYYFNDREADIDDEIQ